MIHCNSANYTPGRTERVAYIVMHYTANHGDTAVNNCTYFSDQKTGASAHYFVDEIGWQLSVPEKDTAWHCGAKRYLHPTCRNANSIGVELCSRKDLHGGYYFLPETVENAQKLVRELLGRYRLDKRCVLRHYDVTGKVCPAPFVKNAGAWQAFLAGLKEEKQVEKKSTNPSDWAIDAALWAIQKKLFLGDGTGNFRWKEPVTREELAVLLKRMWELKSVL